MISVGEMFCLENDLVEEVIVGEVIIGEMN
jgi:hypothetical protein